MAQLFANNAASKLATSITTGNTTITVNAGEGAKFPTITGADNFLVTLVGGTQSTETSWEIVSVTARAGDVLTIVRAQEGTAAAAWAIGTPVELRATAGTLASLATKNANAFTAAQEWTTGANIASAATINLDTATGNRVHITGVTTITAVTLTRGPRTVIFDGVLTLTHNATTNNLPGAANITTAVGDRAIYESDGTTVYCVDYVRASGVAVVAGPSGAMILLSTITATAATTVDVETTFSSTYDAYVLVVTGLTVSASSSLLARLKLGGAYDTGANYKYFVSRADSSSAVAVGQASNVDTAFDLFVSLEAAASASTNFRINIYSPTSTTKYKALDWMGGTSYGTNHYQGIGVGRNVGTAAMTGIRFYPSVGTVSGTFRLYGIANT